MQHPCKQCGKWTEKKKGDWHQLCREHDHERRYGPTPSPSLSPSRSPSPSPPLFDHDPSTHSRLTPLERSAIVTLHELGMSRRQVSDRIPCDIHTVNRWIKDYEHDGILEEHGGRGRKRKVDDMTPAIVQYAIDHPHESTPKEIKHELQLPVCARTVRRRLDKHGLYGRVARNEYPYSDEHIRSRLSFGNGYADWTEEKWDTVVWSDECPFPLGTHGQHWVQRPRGAAWEEKYMLHDKRPHPPTLTLWGCMSGRGMGEMHLYSGSMDAEMYTSFLSMHLWRSVVQLFGDPPGQWWFQQDNPLVHTGRVASHWFASHGIDLLEFPPYSPDLSPIENLWADLKRRVEKHNARDTTELSRYIRQEWTATDPSFLSRIVHSMPDRCKAVVQSKGHKTPY